jgi:hypothetical protein
VYPPGTVNVPPEAVVNALASSAVGADPFPAMPAANSCTLAPLTGCNPALTFPVNETPAAGVLTGHETGVLEVVSGVQVF